MYIATRRIPVRIRPKGPRIRTSIFENPQHVAEFLATGVLCRCDGFCVRSSYSLGPAFQWLWLYSAAHTRLANTSWLSARAALLLFVGFLSALRPSRPGNPLALRGVAIAAAVLCLVYCLLLA